MRLAGRHASGTGRLRLRSCFGVLAWRPRGLGAVRDALVPQELVDLWVEGARDFEGVHPWLHHLHPLVLGHPAVPRPVHRGHAAHTNTPPHPAAPRCSSNNKGAETGGAGKHAAEPAAA